MKNPTREKTPIILQMDNAECGAVALAIILGYFGRFVSISEMRDACDVSRDGSKAINLIKASRRYGLESHGMQISLEKALTLPPPFIVFWEFNHFLVVEGFDNDRVFLNDPAVGHQTITLEEFSRRFTGIVLFMYPGADFETGGIAEPSLFQWLWRRLTGHRDIYVFIILIASLMAFPIIGLALATKIFLDQILLAGQQPWLPGLLLCLFIGACLMGLLTWVKRFYLIRLFLRVKVTDKTRFFWRLLHLPLNFFQQRATGDIVDRIEAHNTLAEALADKTTSQLSSLLMILIMILTMFFLSWSLATITLLIALITLCTQWMLSNRNNELGQAFAQIEGKLSAIEMNGLQIIETLKANAVESKFFNHWAAVHAQKMMHQQKIEHHAAILKTLPLLSQGLNMAIILAVGTWLILRGQLSPGGLIATEILLLGVTVPLLDLLSIGDYFSQLRGEVARILDVERQELDKVLNDDASAQKIPEISSEPILELRNVTFGYSKLEPPIFVDVSFKIHAGERIAIVGPTGGGKSSLAKLICGLYQPWSGEILIRGIPLSKITRSELAKLTAMIDQQIYLFAASIRDNLTLWDSEQSDQMISAALKLAQLDEVIKERGGLDSWVEEQGKNFSGGQVQRLEIARALIQDPPILILDEATAALDPLIEQKIYENLLSQNRALIIIAHRLSAIRDCDQIIVINQGQIVQQGRHEQLILESGLYKELVSLEIQ